MKTLYRCGLPLLAVFLLSLSVVCQQSQKQQAPPVVASGNSSVKVTIAQLPDNPPSLTDTRQSSDTIVLSGTATTARIADPNELVIFSGRVMRMADFVAAVSSNNAAVQRPRNPEMRNREKVQPTPPSPPSN